MLLIFTPFNSNRLKYVADYVFRKRLCLEYEITNDLEFFVAQKNLPKFSYSSQNIDDGLFFFASSPILDETDIKPIALDKGYYNNSPVLFTHQNNNSVLPFDIFAALFYLLSRYEEYVYKEKDEYGNFDYRQSILYKLNVLDKPLVDEWINILKNILKEHFSFLNFKNENPRYVLTFDIDVAYEYKNRTVLRTLGGLAKKLITLNFKPLQDHVFTLLNKKRDSFDTYQYIQERIQSNSALFFFNMGKYGKFDKNPSHKNKVFRQLICSIQQKYFIGIHPSYASNYNQKLLAEEKKMLEEIAEQKVTISRQHYLKIEMPETFKRLLQNGIEKDFSTGYYLSYGFRAGTCHPFPFFDLTTNEATSLYLYPFAFMDGTLNEVLHLSAANAKEHISQLIETVKNFNGIFIPIWHNSTLSETGIWKDWRSVFEHMMNELEEKKFEGITNIEEK